MIDIWCLHGVPDTELLRAGDADRRAAPRVRDRPRAAELSDGAVRLSTGTLYALLERAIDEGLVVAGEPYLERGRQRRDYTLTQIGRTALQAEADRLAQRREDGHATASCHGERCGPMIRERVARAALQAYPTRIRSARGAEMVGTLLDASASSRTRFAREIVDLVRSGLRARATRTERRGHGALSPTGSASAECGC